MPASPALGADAALDAFTAPDPPTGSPRVRVNMVASVDGATSADGESRGLSGPADRRVFHRLRGLADAVLAGAATVRADRYGPARAGSPGRTRNKKKLSTITNRMVKMAHPIFLSKARVRFKVAP